MTKTPQKPGECPETQRVDTGETAAVAVKEQLILRVLDGQNQGRTFPCGDKRIRIGSAPDNDVVIRESWISRHHAEIEPDHGRLIIRDQESTNGTFLNGVRIQSANLHPGLRIQLGRTTLELSSESQRIVLDPMARDRFGRLLGGSAVLRQIYTLLERIAPSMISVLIMGPTGAGKDVVARTLHEESPRCGAPFVVLDCGAADAGLISAEIFGHEAGAFTGAAGRRPGIFEQAKGGTVFLDELGELPLELQPKLLRVLESRELRRLGGTTTIPLDIRIIAATNRDLEWMCAKGQFRQDLYWRLCQMRINLPTLDQHREDIPLLAARMLQDLSVRGPDRSFSPQAMDFLMNAHYPGNIRQLKNIVERVALLAPGARIERADFLPFEAEFADLGTRPAGAVAQPRPIDPPTAPNPAPEPETTTEPDPDPKSQSAPKWRWGTGGRDKDSILAVLEANDWNLTNAARALGIALNTLKARMERFGLSRERPTGPNPEE